MHDKHEKPQAARQPAGPESAPDRAVGGGDRPLEGELADMRTSTSAGRGVRQFQEALGQGAHRGVAAGPRQTWCSVWSMRLDDLARFAHVVRHNRRQTMHDGVDMVDRKVWKVLEAAGVTRVDQMESRRSPRAPSGHHAARGSPGEGSHGGGDFAAGVSDGRRADRPARVIVLQCRTRRTGERGREVDGFAERLLPDPRRVRLRRPTRSRRRFRRLAKQYTTPIVIPKNRLRSAQGDQ